MPVDLRLVLGVRETVRVPVSPTERELGVTEAALMEVGSKLESTADVEEALVDPAEEARVIVMPEIGRVEGGLMKFDTLICTLL